VDSVYSHAAWAAQSRKQGGLGGVAFPLLSDITKEISRSFGFLVEEPTDGMNGVGLRGTVRRGACGEFPAAFFISILLSRAGIESLSTR
jgi:hypothetical protein